MTVLRKILFPATVVSVLLLLLSSFAGSNAPSHYSYLSILGLFYPLILFANIALGLLLLLFRSKLALLPLLGLLIGFHNLNENFRIGYGHNDPVSGDSTELKVLTYNVKQFRNGLPHRQNDIHEKIIDFINGQQPDIVCLQEYEAGGNQLYEGLKKDRDSLHLPTYYYESYYNPRYDLLSGLATFSNLEAAGSGRLKTEGSRTFGIYTDLLLNGDTIRVFNIHLASIKLGNDDLEFMANPTGDKETGIKFKALAIFNKLITAFELREKQLTELRRVLDHTPHSIILAGDFNDTPSSYVYHELRQTLDDSFVEKGSGLSTTFAGPIPFLRIDYLMNRGFTTLDYQRYSFKQSDHYPISTTLNPLNHD